MVEKELRRLMGRCFERSAWMASSGGSYSEILLVRDVLLNEEKYSLSCLLIRYAQDGLLVNPDYRCEGVEGWSPINRISFMRQYLLWFNRYSQEEVVAMMLSASDRQI